MGWPGVGRAGGHGLCALLQHRSRHAASSCGWPRCPAAWSEGSVRIHPLLSTLLVQLRGSPKQTSLVWHSWWMSDRTPRRLWQFLCPPQDTRLALRWPRVGIPRNAALGPCSSPSPRPPTVTATPQHFPRHSPCLNLQTLFWDSAQGVLMLKSPVPTCPPVRSWHRHGVGSCATCSWLSPALRIHQVPLRRQRSATKTAIFWQQNIARIRHRSFTRPYVVPCRLLPATEPLTKRLPNSNERTDRPALCSTSTPIRRDDLYFVMPAGAQRTMTAARPPPSPARLGAAAIEESMN